jgi:hypothetical protein
MRQVCLKKSPAESGAKVRIGLPVGSSRKRPPPAWGRGRAIHVVGSVRRFGLTMTGPMTRLVASAMTFS